MNTFFKIIFAIAIIFIFFVVLPIYTQDQTLICLLFFLVLFFLALFEIMKGSIINQKSQNGIAELKKASYVRLLSDYEIQKLCRMACNLSDDKVYRLNGIATYKNLSCGKGACIRYTFLNDIKINVFSELSARQYININKHNSENVVISGNELIIVTINNHFLI